MDGVGEGVVGGLGKLGDEIGNIAKLTQAELGFRLTWEKLLIH